MAEDSRINEAHLEAILKDPRSKAALLKKMGLGEDTNKDQHPTLSGMNVGGWPPHLLAPLGCPGLFPPFHYGPDASRAQPMPTWREGRGPEGRWVGLRYEPEEDASSSHTEEPGPSNKRPRHEEGEMDDTISLLDDAEALELVEFDPKVKPAGTWEPPKTIRNFLERQFNKSLSEEERESIMKDFPKPNVDAVVTPRLAGDAVEQLKSKGKNPHIGTEKALYNTQKQLLDVTGPLTCLWADLLNKEAKVSPEDILLLIQRALVLLGSASHSISIERRKTVWAKMNPKLRSLGSEEYGERGTDLFGPGFLAKASKRLEVEKTLAKVAKPLPQSVKKGRYENNKSDVRSFFIQGRFGSVREREESPPPTVHLQSVPKRKKIPISGGAQPKGERSKEAKLPGQILQPITNPDPQIPMRPSILGTILVPIPQLENLPEAGRLRFCLVNWKRVTSDPWIWQVVMGHSLELIANPRQDSPPKPIMFAAYLSRMISDKICELELKSAIQKVDLQPDQFISQIFLVPKKDGGQRPVVKLKPLNRLIARYKFKMQSARTLKDLVRKDDWMVSIDLKDAYLSVPINERDRKYLRFTWEDRIYEFRCFPFGLSSAPKVFTKLLKPVMALLRQRGLRSTIFLDDMLLMAESRQDLECRSQEVLSLLRLLGFRVNWEKSQLLPTYKLMYLGLTINTILMTLTLPEEKMQKILKGCQSALQRDRLSVRDLSRLIGMMSTTTLAVLPAPPHYRELQELKIRQLKATQSFKTTVVLNDKAKAELQWWIAMLNRWNGHPILPLAPDLVIETDASLLGWGAATKQMSTGGLWSELERAHHINLLELAGGALATKTFTKGRKNIHVLLKMDNTTAITYINRMGGTRSRTLSQAACNLWHWSLQRGITLSVVHLPGVQNSRADGESRTLQSSAEWMLESSISRNIIQILGPCSVDLFATRLNNQLRRYASWRPDPFATATDAFTMSWQEEVGYAFPPFSVIGRCLQKIRQEESTVVLVTPVWDIQPWYPVLLDLLVEYPLMLPTHKKLLVDPFNRVHPLVVQNQLQLAAWRLSGKATLQREFQNGLQNSSDLDGVMVPTKRTSQAGPGGLAGVIRGKLIPLQGMSSTFSSF